MITNVDRYLGRTYDVPDGEGGTIVITVVSFNGREFIVHDDSGCRQRIGVGIFLSAHREGVIVDSDAAPFTHAKPYDFPGIK
jgi:hypothetical protein